MHELVIWMFDSVQGGVLPVCFLSALSAFGFAYLRQRWLGLFLAILVAIAIGYGWFHLPEILWPSSHTERQGGWDLVATVFWSIFSIPVAVIALFTTRRYRANKASDAV